MTTHKATNCPFAKTTVSTTKQKIQFEAPPYKNWIKSSFSNMKEISSRFGFESFKNAWLSYSLADFNTIFSKTCQFDEIVSDFKTPIGTQYIIKDHATLQLVLSHFRNKENGYFHVPENKKIFIDGIVKDLYPEELAAITDLEKDVINKMIFTAESIHIPALRANVMSFLKQKSVHDYRGQIDEIASEILDGLTSKERDVCDPAFLVFEFAVTVICKLFIGYFVSREQYQEIVKAMMVVSAYISDTITHKSLSKEKKALYNQALQTMKQLIDLHLANGDASPLIKSLRENGFSEFTIKLYLFFFYIASTETTSAVTHYLLLELGRDKNKHFQEMIRTEGRDSIFLKKCVVEALRLNPSVFIMGRTLREDQPITVRDENDRLLWSKLLLKGHHIVCWIAGAGRDPKVFPNPDEFNPSRFESVPTFHPWLPFTTGPHTCPGQFLAKAEMESLITEILLRFDICNNPADVEIETRGTFTLHADPHSKIKMKFTSLAK